jgi:coenzyme F420 hydrogenase subunit beta
MAKIKNIQDVAQFQLCTGCGMCASIEPQRFFMKDILKQGLRPFIKKDAPEETGDALKSCPGIGLQHNIDYQDPKLVKSLVDDWGPIYEVMEGYAVDEEIRFSGSSGGVVTALGLYCLEKGRIPHVLHTAAQKETPYLNETVISKSKEDLLKTTGSRYAPASPCDSIEKIENNSEKSVFIGKPCDITAIQQARKIRPKLDENLGLTIAFFCAGVPSTEASLKLMEKEGITSPDAVNNLRYRGKGWPGHWAVQYKNNQGSEDLQQLTYAKSWGFLQQFRQWRCYICPDHTGEFADLSIGDPWYKDVKPGDAGKSLIVVRTQRGQQLLRKAVDAGYIIVEENNPSLLPRSQPNLLDVRASLWARLLVLRLLGAGVPRYEGFKLFSLWWNRLNALEKVRSVLGTAKRVYKKKLHQRGHLKQ